MFIDVVVVANIVLLLRIFYLNVFGVVSSKLEDYFPY